MLDSCSLSNYPCFNVKHTNLHFEVLFKEKRISGVVEYELENVHETKSLILDTSYLQINSVQVNGTSVNYELGARTEPFGSPLKIPIDSATNLSVKIEFKTTDKSTAIQFIQGDTGDYIFSQCQAIHARSLFPCFDTPGVKSPYSFSAKSPLPCLMSGRPNAEKTANNVYYFDQPIPIPSYLVSITSGNLHSAKIGPRSKVYCEEPNLQACKWEFEKDMENFIQIAEKLIFDYEWGTFDSLVLPSSFPYGGMEIPNITQLTPTLICHDRTQVKVMAHELAHSWSGNLVTNSTWGHFWLNEGWTVYIERRILENIAAFEKGKEYGEQVRQFNAILGWNSLVEAVNTMDPKFTSLEWDLHGVDPDDAFSRIPYEKGFNFIYYLEQVVGGKIHFDPFIKHYFTVWRYKSLDSFQFKETFIDFYSDKGINIDNIDWEAWLFAPGLPPVIPKFDTTLADNVYKLVKKWVQGFEDLDLHFEEQEIDNFESNQQVLFLEDLNSLLESIESDKSKLLIDKLAKVYPKFDASENGEIILRWATLLLKYGGHNKPDDKKVLKFANWLGTVGRMKFVRPGYKLLDQIVGHDFAVETFNKFEAKYHPICRAMVKKDLHLDTVPSKEVNTSTTSDGVLTTDLSQLKI